MNTMLNICLQPESTEIMDSRLRGNDGFFVRQITTPNYPRKRPRHNDAAQGNRSWLKAGSCGSDFVAKRAFDLADHLLRFALTLLRDTFCF